MYYNIVVIILPSQLIDNHTRRVSNSEKLLKKLHIREILKIMYGLLYNIKIIIIIKIYK